ncbi:Uncharacterized conserved protein YcbK, DUF882 family [Filomicrobium insigne]|uniref:Murein endopeptidase K n=1 Tax=Filomicrobium insigne TaxID=418854 RepID=A0A1H0G206_9HYPH|nr:DUF882 domain-containing protein [Filomicrobium insigne]SDO00925.1 Uncharacterized conserved protein YcbK, DUF882 family [Filomicrobium insigne]
MQFSLRLRATCLLGVLALAGLASTHLLADRKDERRIALYNIHTKETLDIVYMRDGKRIPEAMTKINWMLRDWRRDEATKMDPELIDILWELKTELGATKPIHIISGYRSEKTNKMLRQTRGGQAKKSRHILGMAADVHFPDVPLKKLRYSALVREKGGVGYYPTSAIPFVHVDTGRVRHWPRMPRYELALLFPNGHSKHVPADGHEITKSDVQIARKKEPALATQIAAFHDFRARPHAPAPVLVANGWNANVQAHQHDTPEMPTRPYQVASLGPIAPPAPRLAERPSHFRSGPDEADRRQLADLVARASVNPLMGLFSAMGKKEPAEARGIGAAFARPPAKPQDETARHADSRFGWSNGWVTAPAYDEEHPDELFYRPFPLAPFLTASESADDPALAQMQHPDVSATLEFVSDEISALPMRFTPGGGIAELLWTQQFTPAPGGSPPTIGRGGLENRRVQTSMR